MDNNYKRQYRQLDDTTKQKISQSLKGRTKSATHTQAISNGLKSTGLMFQTSRIITKIKLKNMNKVYGLNIDMLRLCYEIKEPYNINIIKTKEVGEEIDFMYFYLRRIQGKHFKFVYEIRYDDMGKDKLFGELRLGINDDEEASNIHTNGYNKAWISISNRVLYTDEIYYLDFIESNLGLELHNITTLDLCLDMSIDIARLIRRLIRNPQITTILNGKRIIDRKQDRPEITYTSSGNMDRINT